MPLPRSLLNAQARDLDLRLIAGSWPSEISGEVLISAPEISSENVGHPFFTPGIMHRLSLEPGTNGAPGDAFAWRMRSVRTPSRRLAERHPELFPPGPFGSLLSPAGFLNGANTAPLPWGDRLFATWDVGRPVELDPVTLDFLGEVGHKDHWNPMIPGMGSGVFPFVGSTAHPVIDPDRDLMWSVNLGSDMTALDKRAISVVRYTGDGPDVDVWPVAHGLIPGSMHTISQTPEWLILIDSGGFKLDMGEASGGERTVLMDEEESVFFIRKDALDTATPGEPVDAVSFCVGPAVGHFYAAYEQGDTVRVLFEHMENVDLAFYMRADDVDATGRRIDPEMVGMYAGAMSPARLTEFEFDPGTGAVKEQAIFAGDERHWGGQLSAMDWSAEGLAAPKRHHMTFMGWRPEMISRRELDLYAAAGRVDPAALPDTETASRLATLERGRLGITAEHEFELDEFASSPAFVPRDPGTDSGKSRYAGSNPGGHDGWVVTPVHADSGFRIEVFDAADVGAGPVATLAAAGNATVPVLLHSAWMPRAVPAPGVERLAFADEVDTAALAGLTDDVAASIREIAQELSGE